MLSQDEQIILEELHRFPNQILTRERNQTMLENIRKERRKMQIQKKRRKYLTWAANGIFATVVLLAFAFIAMKPSSVPVETMGSKALIEQKYITAAKKEIKENGITRQFDFDEMDKDTEYFTLRSKIDEAIVTFLPDTTEVFAVSVACTIDELPKRYQKYVETAQAALKEANQEITLQNVRFFKNKEESTLTFQLDNNQFVTVDLEANKVTLLSLFYNLGALDKKYMATAENSLKRFSNNDNITFTHLKKSTDRREDIWTLSNEKHNLYSVEIGAKTGKIYRVDYVTNNSKIKSVNEVIPVTKPLIKDIFGLDITGYKVYGGRSWGGYVLKSEGKPNIVIKIYDLNIGNICSIIVEG